MSEVVDVMTVRIDVDVAVRSRPALRIRILDLSRPAVLFLISIHYKWSQTNFDLSLTFFEIFITRLGGLRYFTVVGFTFLFYLLRINVD
jgi:hypothetical protein